MGFALRNSFLVVALVLFLAVSAAVPPGAVVAATNAYNGSFSMQWHAVEEEEWALDSETNRRILQSTKKYIGYHAIKDKNTPAAPARSKAFVLRFPYCFYRSVHPNKLPEIIPQQKFIVGSDLHVMIGILEAEK
ncbi:hypothetical protein COCNU_06G016000 [Cocos nucifera]|uniref:Uncharacterized protein n=1 Tax=Cocos nucifera TaxID=13894 RepID=A0A8K0ICK8_COCNU|nr:hypothetical protein COCNU_06G016000 [Cocos nucifera]